MKTEDKFEYCAHCSKSTFSMEEGRRCALTGKGPEFEDRCEHFDGDEAEVEKAIKEEQRAVEESVGIHGFLAFYLYFCVIGGIILTIISTLVSYVPRADDGLMNGAYSVVSASRAYSINWSLLACDILMLVSFVSIGIYTVVAFHKRLPNAVALAKTHLIWAAVTNGLVLLTGSVGNGAFDNPVRLIFSLVWAGIFFTYLTVSEDVKILIPKETRHLYKGDKIALISIIVAILLLFGHGVLEAAGASFTSSTDKNIDRQIELTNAQLPTMLSEGVEYCSIERDGENVIFLYKLKNVHIDYIPAAALEEGSLMTKERLIYGLNSTKDKFMDIAAKSHNLEFRYIDADGANAYSAKISPEEYAKACVDGFMYRTEPETLNRILELGSNMIPEELIPGTKFNSISFVDNQIVFNFTITGVNSTEMQGITNGTLRQYLEDNLAVLYGDAIELAMMNKIPITFDFKSDTIDWWEQSVTFNPDEYEAILNAGGN